MFFSDRFELKRELDEKEQEAARNNKREKIDEEKFDSKKALEWFEKEKKKKKILCFSKMKGVKKKG